GSGSRQRAGRRCEFGPCVHLFVLCGGSPVGQNHVSLSWIKGGSRVAMKRSRLSLSSSLRLLSTLTNESRPPQGRAKKIVAHRCARRQDQGRSAEGRSSRSGGERPSLGLRPQQRSRCLADAHPWAVRSD